MRFLASLLAGLLTMPLLAAPPGEAQAPDRGHWSLQARTRPIPPRLEGPAQRAWARTPVDAFILRQLSQKGLQPAPEADRATLIRRVTFDLTGLPPTPEEVEVFLNDSAPDAWEGLVDRLLASPAYGERWGRHWLDVVRYAETEGFEYDRHRPGAWRYRDYVIGAFNEDRPFDRFILEQIAGDEIDPESVAMQVAAGFHRLGPVRRNAGNQELAFSRNEVLTERADAIGAAFLGLTVGCARCHDHKFDPISQADYYHLQAFFASSYEVNIPLASPREQAEWKQRTEKIEAEIKQLRQTLGSLTGSVREEIERKIHDLEEQLPAPLPTISTVHNSEPKRTPIHILKRGDTDHPERQVGPRLPSVLAPAAPELPADVSRPRTRLARWIASPENPLTARVLVNRLWQYHLGRGIVDSANDFGSNGSRPSHPELLDWLANELVAGGWRIKPIHRLIVLSATYRQLSRHPDPGPGLVKDTDNRLLWHFPSRRLDAEEVRDAMLMISGRLSLKAGGASVIVPVEEDLVKLLYKPSQWAVTEDPREHDRRSVYLIAKRNLRLPFMEAFDLPDAQTSCACRVSSTHPLQSLELLNGDLANRLARSLAGRLRREAGADPAAQVELAWLLAAGRAPTPREKELAVAFLREQPLEEFALAVFSLNAFLYVK